MTMNCKVGSAHLRDSRKTDFHSREIPATFVPINRGFSRVFRGKIIPVPVHISSLSTFIAFRFLCSRPVGRGRGH